MTVISENSPRLKAITRVEDTAAVIASIFRKIILPFREIPSEKTPISSYFSLKIPKAWFTFIKTTAQTYLFRNLRNYVK